MNVNTYTPGSTLNMFSFRTLEQANLTAGDIKEQDIAFADVMPAFSTKSLDAHFLIEPLTNARRGARARREMQGHEPVARTSTVDGDRAGANKSAMVCSHGFMQTAVDLDTVWDPAYVDYVTGVVGKR
ncbi:MAG: hypothetical protein NVSMB2_02710 [Chloroflexota bacterium]